MGCNPLIDGTGKVCGWLCCTNVYQLKGWTFEYHDYFGPQLVRKKDLEPFSRPIGEKSKFWPVFEEFFKMSDEEREKYLIAS